MRALLSVAFYLIAGLAVADKQTFDIKFGGAVAGTNTLELKPDGSFDSQTKFTVQGVTVESRLQGTLKENRLTTFTFSEKAGPSGATITFDGKEARVEVNGKEVGKPIPFAPKTKAIFANYHPVLLATIAAEAKGKRAIDLVIINSLQPLRMELDVVENAVAIGGRAVSVTRLSGVLQGVKVEFAVSDSGGIGFSVPTQMFQIVRTGYDAVFESPLAKYPELSPPIFKSVTDRRVRARMRDGVALMADIMRPDKPGRYPTILVRTPYGRDAALMGMMQYVERGYVVVSQDVRGRGGSDGRWDPFNAEVADGKDTLDWIVQQPWSNGNVGMIGGSYLGYVQWAAAVNGHPALKCIIPQVSPPEPTRNVPWDHGNFLLAGSVWWSRIVADRKADLASAGSIPNMKALLTLPLSKVDDKLIGRDVPFFNDFLRRPNRSDWVGAFTTSQVAQVRIPVLHVSGAWDGDGVGTMIHWQALRGKGSQWLVFGPWDHGFNTRTRMGDQDFGVGAILELDSVYLRFFDTFLKGRDVQWSAQPRVRFFETGSNRWITGPDWPLPTARQEVRYLVGARSSGRFGTLGSRPGVGSDTIHYDPTKAKLGQGALEVDASKAVTSVAEKDLKGALTYRSEPFSRDTSIAGPVVADLFVSSSVRDASFHVQVFDQDPKGRLWAIAMAGSMRVGFVDGTLSPIVPHRVYRIKVEPWLFARRFKKGHRLAIVIRNDLFPGFARNPGTGEPDVTATRMVRATNRVHTSAKCPSRVSYWVLPD